MMNKSRRTFIKRGVIGGALGILAQSTLARPPTPSETEGPFYPVIAQKDKNFDLTTIEGQEGQAQGKIIIIQGKVLDTDNQPIEDAVVDLWQANAAGKYRHPYDNNKASLDPNFQGWAIVLSGKEGAFRFKTIYPGAYPVSGSWIRPPHIHFKVSKKGYLGLTTQMYFPEHELNGSDHLLNRKSREEQSLMIASRMNNDPEVYEYSIVLQKA